MPMTAEEEKIIQMIRETGRKVVPLQVNRFGFMVPVPMAMLMRVQIGIF